MQIKTKKLTLMSVLTSVALIVHIIEAHIPLPLPIWGAKLGLANVVTLFAFFYENDDENLKLSTTDVFMILLCRIILGSVFSGKFISFIYSLSGGLFAFASQAIMKRIVSKSQIWVCGAIGAVFHNIGQILAAMLVTSTPQVVVLLPQLTIIGILTGIITGSVSQFACNRLNRVESRKGA